MTKISCNRINGAWIVLPEWRSIHKTSNSTLSHVWTCHAMDFFDLNTEYQELCAKSEYIRKRNYTIAKSAFQYHEWLICLNFIVVLPASHNWINFQLNTCPCRTKHTSHFNNIYVFLRSAHDFIVFPFFLFFSFKIYMKMDAIRELLKLLLMLLIALFHRP